MRSDRGVERGFILIEPFMAVAILAILAALLVASLSGARTRSQSTTCKNYLRQVRLSLQMYVDEDRNRYPYLRGLADPDLDPVTGASDTRWWQECARD